MLRDSFDLDVAVPTKTLVVPFQIVSTIIYNYSNYNLLINFSTAIPNELDFEYIIAPNSFGVLTGYGSAISARLMLIGVPSVVNRPTIHVFNEVTNFVAQDLPIPVGFSSSNMFIVYPTTVLNGTTITSAVFIDLLAGDLTLTCFVPTGKCIVFFGGWGFDSNTGAANSASIALQLLVNGVAPTNYGNVDGIHRQDTDNSGGPQSAVNISIPVNGLSTTASLTFTIRIRKASGASDPRLYFKANKNVASPFLGVLVV